jgi:hypothetical protein
MTEPFGASAAAFGLAINAMQIAQPIRGLVSGMKNVSKSLHRLGEVLGVFEMILLAASEIGCEYEYVGSALRDCKQELEPLSCMAIIRMLSDSFFQMIR